MACSARPISVGAEGRARRTQAAKVLEQLTSQTPVFSKVRYIVMSFGIRENEQIAVCHTVSGAKAEGIREEGLKVRECELWKNNFSNMGNFGFEIKNTLIGP
ncbi:hypothetical protein U0070_013288 [Myodes glareolus]|uniref:Uncharacterized protein n=1 Tax=Myodes glareolus TaxID=447135 RepID=A0AAW0JSS4_MYOGA